MVAVIFIAFICAVISAIVASNKGASTAAGFIAGLLLGPLGIVAVLVTGGKKCPECRGNIVPDATRCKNCGIVLPTASLAAKAEPKPKPQSDEERHREMLKRFHDQRGQSKSAGPG